MDLEDLRRLAKFYGVPTAALLAAPEEGVPMSERMIRAAGKAANMTDQDADEWLRLGERFEKREPAAE